MNNIIKRVWNQNRMVNIEDLSGMAFQAESGGHTFEISGVNDAGETVALSGSVAGVFMRPDLADIAIVGSATDGVVSVTLPADCYAVNGRFALTIFVTSDSQKVAVYAAVGTVTRTSGGAVAGDTPQDVVDLINAINAAVNSIPADLTNLMGAIAPTYSSSALYAKGAYAWYDGVLYKAVVDISTAESFTAAHWNVSAIGNDVADLINCLGAASYRSNKKTATSTYNATIAYNGDIAAVTSESAHLNIYPVEANKLYVLYGLQVRVVATTLGNALAVFNTSLFDGETTLTGNTIIVPKDTSGVATDYNVTFRPTANGYVYIYSYGNYNALELYDGVYRSTTLDNISVSTKPSESYDVSFADIFDKYESAFIDDFTARASFVDSDHPYTILGSDANAPTITTGVGATRMGASGMATLAYSRTFDSFPYVCLIGRVAGASQYVKVFDDSSNVIAGAISIGASGNVRYNRQVYGKIHVNAAYDVLIVNSDSVTLYDDSGVETRIPVSYTPDKPMNIALGFGADASLYGYGSFVEFVKRPMQTLDFNRCVAENEDASSLSAVRDVIRFTHAVWNGGAVASFYSKPSDNPYMEIVSGLSNNPCIKCICDYAVDNGYRTEIGITPIRGSLKGILGGLQRFRVSADYFMASADNPGTDDFYTYIFQLHDANFAMQGWNDGPPLDLRVYNGKLSAYVCYIDNGAVPQGDNVHTVDSYDLCDWTMDAWHHIEVEARIGWRNVLAPRLIIRVDGIERLNIETPLGYNIVSSGGYVNTHFGNYVPQWHDASYPTTHSEVIVTNIRWEGTQNVN